ncbi:unnamed protein product [Knipowitschia caucasica]|uniref:Uncharacterized protein n=1 Tax=Knipowitschia caucasica TaxID=637954 RepID=A0AAV2KQ82_KNICA
MLTLTLLLLILAVGAQIEDEETYDLFIPDEHLAVGPMIEPAQNPRKFSSVTLSPKLQDVLEDDLYYSGYNEEESSGDDVTEVPNNEDFLTSAPVPRGRSCSLSVHMGHYTTLIFLIFLTLLQL